MRKNILAFAFLLTTPVTASAGAQQDWGDNSLQASLDRANLPVRAAAKDFAGISTSFFDGSDIRAGQSRMHYRPDYTLTETTGLGHENHPYLFQWKIPTETIAAWLFR